MSEFPQIEKDFTEGWEEGYKQAKSETADTITRQQAEIERLREALERVVTAADFYSQPGTDGMASRYAHESHARLARAALNGEGK